MELKGLGILITLFVTVIVGLVLLVPTANTVQGTQIASNTKLNETYTLTANQTQQLVYYPIASVQRVSYVNATGVFGIDSTSYTLNTETGIFKPINGSSWLYSINYTYYGNYVRDAPSRSMASLVTLFFTISVLIAAVVYAKKAWGDLF